MKRAAVTYGQLDKHLNFINCPIWPFWHGSYVVR